jgi:hypothetical protein
VGDPDEAIGVDRGAVGIALPVRNAHERPPVGDVAAGGMKSQADTMRVGVSVWYIVRPSGLQQSALETTMPSIRRRQERSASSR